MRILYSPFYSGDFFVNLKESVMFDVQVLDTPGLLCQLALHAGIHQTIPTLPERLTAYHQALKDFDKAHPENIFHKSLNIDSMGIAKTLIRWRDELALCGWSARIRLENNRRLNDLAEIDSRFEDKGLASLFKKLEEQIGLMVEKKISVPNLYQDLVIEIPCKLDLLPDYILPLFESLSHIGVRIDENPDDPNAFPARITEIRFSQQWKAEAWLSQQDATKFNLWINGDNKRLDNWLHMSGQAASGSQMKDSNPQATQLFLLAVQLFQRPLNINTLLQYLQLPACPLYGRRAIADSILREGGFCNENVISRIRENIGTDTEKEENYNRYLPFDLRSEDAPMLAEESEAVNVSRFKKFLTDIGRYAAERAATKPDKGDSAQLLNVKEMTDLLVDQLAGASEPPDYTTLLQWAKSIYEKGTFSFYPAQIGSRYVISQPANMADTAEKVVWCDFYGDVSTALSTDFLSNAELQQLRSIGIRLWDRDNEKQLVDRMMARPLHKTSEELTIITCSQQGATLLPQHPLYLQLPKDRLSQQDGDKAYRMLKSKEIFPLDNHREEDLREICFDAKTHPVPWRDKESFSSLEKLLQNPFDYLMKYPLKLSAARGNELTLRFAYGNVAHEVIELLLAEERVDRPLAGFVSEQFETIFRNVLARKGALLLLPEHHLEKERLKNQLCLCVKRLATIIQENNLTVVGCEKKYEEDLQLEDGVLVEGFMDILLRDADGQDVVFDLKWSAKKGKYKTLLENNRALQLAIYSTMLRKRRDDGRFVRTAYFVIPAGKLYSTDDFVGDFCEKVSPKDPADLMEQLRNGYAERKREIMDGRVETADNISVRDLAYANVQDVFPLEREGTKKKENLYSDYKVFTS